MSSLPRRLNPPPVLTPLVLAVLLAGCPGKYRPVTLPDFNQEPPQAAAVITLSDPQIYSRETLVNDRRREAEYLEELLEESETAVFEPQIRRDLRTLTSTVLRLQARYDPLSGRQAARSEELAEIQQRIDETEALQKLAEARVKLIEAEGKLDELAAQDEAKATTHSTTDPEDDEGSGDDDSEDDGSGDDGDQDPEETEKEVEALRANVEEIKSLIAALPSVAEVRQTAVGATPGEVFRDRQAYRGELRGALSEVELDDSHDQDQNSLYRLQFRATVLPGRHRDKMGVARLTLHPPSLKDDDVLALYKTWLGHVTYRLNQAVGEELHHDTSYLLLGMGLDRSLFHSTCYSLSGTGECTDDNRDRSLLIALPPEIYARWKRATYDAKATSEKDQKPDMQIVEDKVQRAKEVFHQFYDPSNDLSTLAMDCDCEPPEQAEWKEHWDLLKELSKIEPFVSASVRGLGDRNLLSPELVRRLDDLIHALVNGSDTLDQFRYLVLEKNPHCKKKLADETTESQHAAVPEVFKRTLLRECSTDPRCTPKQKSDQANGRRVARGGADVYATAPIELAQQVSTTASSFRSFELALALAASLPTEGVGADAALNRLRATRTDLEARERLPLVVGFAERQEIFDPKDEDEVVGENPQFGWVFGPQAALDLDSGKTRLRLHQPVVNQVVTADLSIPGWWPFVTLQSESAWVANWHGQEILAHAPDGEESNGGSPGATVKGQEFRVYLPLNRADLDALTEYLSKSTAGGSLPYTRIAAVSPEKVTTCGDEVTFLVYGANVWRSSRAFLNGLEADDIQVLPDMAGLAVTFKGIRKGLPQVPGDNGRSTLTVWTRNGASSAKVTVLDPKSAGISCGPAPEPSLKLAVASGVLLPGKDDKGKTSMAVPAPAKLRIVQGKLPGSHAKLGISIRPAPAVTGGHLGAWNEPPETSAVLLGEAVDGTVRLPQAEPADGTAFQVSLVVVPAPGAEGKRHPVEGPLVYYSTETEAQIQVKTATLHDLSKPVELILPYRYDQSYPDLEGGKVTFGVEAEGADAGKYELSLKDPTPKELPDAQAKTAAPRKPLELYLVVEKDGKELKTLPEGELKASFTISGGDSLPDVSGSVVISAPD